MDLVFRIFPFESFDSILSYSRCVTCSLVFISLELDFSKTTFLGL